MSDHCPLCGQSLPEKAGRICALCNKPIRRHDRYHHVGGRTVHRDCANPQAQPAIPAPQPSMFHEDK